jgi:predicted nucleotidyltransferase
MMAVEKLGAAPSNFRHAALGDQFWYGQVMSRTDIIAALRERASDIKSFGATSLYLFGSAARDETTEESDVDLFIDYDPERFSFVELIRLRERISSILGRPADLTTREGLHPMLRSAIEAEAVKVL